MTDVRVEREETPVLFVRAEDVGPSIQAAWSDLETRIGSLRGRSFLGTFDPRTNEYRACVVASDDDADAVGLERGVIPGGTYLRRRIRGEPPALYARIPHEFGELARLAGADETRPSLEHYRRHDEIDLLLPVG